MSICYSVATRKDCYRELNAWIMMKCGGFQIINFFVLFSSKFLDVAP